MNLMTGTLVFNQNCTKYSPKSDNSSLENWATCVVDCATIEACENDINEEPACNSRNLSSSSSSSAVPFTTSSRLLTSTTTTIKTKCPANYRLFVRNTVSLCIGVESPLNFVRITKEKGISLCTQAGGQVTGPENVEELNFLRNQSSIIFKNLIIVGVGVWTDGNRKPECSTKETVSKKTCQGIQAFSFTDNTLQSLNGFVFYGKQPDSYIQDCLQLMITNADTNGLFDDLQNSVDQRTKKRKQQDE
uniref:CW domain-containing protein n=2 Tax=Caenorhabditis tropicalis TaxID=1561998 RepID=A0A1I7TYG8_9PELO